MNIEETQTYIVGWNMPGYMPDMDPFEVVGATSALSTLKSCATEYIDELELTDSEYGDYVMAIESWSVDDNQEFGAYLENYFFFIVKTNQIKGF